MAKWQPMSGGLVQVAMVMRVSVGAKYGAQHSQDWSSMVAGVPGLKVVFRRPHTTRRACSPARCAATTQSCTSRASVCTTARDGVSRAALPVDDYLTPIGVPNIVRHGSDLTS